MLATGLMILTSDKRKETIQDSQDSRKSAEAFGFLILAPFVGVRYPNFGEALNSCSYLSIVALISSAGGSGSSGRIRLSPFSAFVLRFETQSSSLTPTHGLKTARTNSYANYLTTLHPLPNASRLEIDFPQHLRECRVRPFYHLESATRSSWPSPWVLL
jgi:hypothetical protein